MKVEHFLLSILGISTFALTLLMFQSCYNNGRDSMIEELKPIKNCLKEWTHIDGEYQRKYWSVDPFNDCDEKVGTVLVEMLKN